MINERVAQRALIIIALAALAIGLAAAFMGRNELAQCIWAAGTIPVVTGLAISIARDVRAKPPANPHRPLPALKSSCS